MNPTPDSDLSRPSTKGEGSDSTRQGDPADKGPAASAAAIQTQAKVIYRHPLATRIFHWVNVVCVLILLLSGFQIFNAHPRLYIGHTGYYGMPAVFEIASNQDLDNPRSWARIGEWTIPTTGVLGMPEISWLGETNTMAFPSWLRLPSADNLAAGRGWHFLMVWIFALNAALYVSYLVVSRRLWREFLPTLKQLRLRSIAADLWMHIRLKHQSGEDARHYNLMQKLAYLTVAFLLPPLVVLTGLTMSNTAVAAFPWLIDMFGGRQTARLIHFVCSMLFVLFIFIHVFQIFVTGFRRGMLSILTGYYEIPREQQK